MSDSVAMRSDTVAAMVEAGAKGRALMGGTTAMRAAGESYLPRFDAESAENYDARLAASWLFNGYRKTVRDMSGRIFDKTIEIVDGSSQLDDWAENIDMEGRDLSTFACDVFKDGLGGSGISYIMVDAPPRDDTVTRAKAQTDNLRPYMVHLSVEDVLGWRAETVGNVTRLTMFRILETVTEPDPEDEFAEVSIEQVRVLDLLEGESVRTRIYRKSDARQKWEQWGEETYSDMTEITVVPFYANRAGFFMGEAVLDDLADVNIAHWQSQSDQRNILHFARVPVLFGAGFDDDASLTIASTKAVTSVDPQAKLIWVEHSGKAIGAGRQDLKDLEFQMETHGLQLLVAQSGAQSATGEALDAKKETSQLSMMADSLQDALETALRWMTAYAGDEQSISVAVNKEFGVSMMTAQDMTALLSAVNTGQLSQRTFLQEMARRGYVRADLDIDREVDLIEGDSEGLMNVGE